jgi:hypothetical protein
MDLASTGAANDILSFHRPRPRARRARQPFPPRDPGFPFVPPLPNQRARFSEQFLDFAPREPLQKRLMARTEESVTCTF